MAKKNFIKSLYDAITDMFNLYGIGNLWDKTGTESPEKMYADMVSIINDNFDKMANDNSSKLNKLNLIMQDLAINAPSPAFKVKIDNIKRQLNKDIDLRNDISRRIESGREVARESAGQLLNKNNRTAEWMKKDVEKEIKGITDKVNKTINNVIDNNKELKNEI